MLWWIYFVKNQLISVKITKNGDSAVHILLYFVLFCGKIWFLVCEFHKFVPKHN